MQLVACGMATNAMTMQFGLAAGNVYQNREVETRQYFESQGWFFWGPSDIRRHVGALAKTAYENDPAVLTAKLLSK